MSRLGSMFGTPAPSDVTQERRSAPGLGSMFGTRDKRAQYRTGTAQSGGGIRASVVPPMAASPDVGLPPSPYVDTTGNDRWVSGVNRATDQQLDRRMMPAMNRARSSQGVRGVRDGSIAVSPGQSFLASDGAASDFNRAASMPFSPQALTGAQVDRRSPVWQRQYAQTFGDAMQADEQRQVDYANQRVDSRLAASQGRYPTPAGREAGWFGRGWDTSMPAQQPERQLTFNPAQNAAANKALYNQHVQSMMNNPEYAARVLDQRAERRQQLDARDAIGDARRQGAIEAAGASQQLRNLMAGRGAIGPGRDGFAALMSMAAMQNPNAAFDNFGEGFMALNAPNMLQQRLNAEQAMQGQRLGVEQAMQGQQIGAQERMLGQELASRRTLADMNVAAQKAQAAAERAFMAAQNTTNFEQQKALAELGYKHQRESDQYSAMMQSIMQADSPQDARRMIGLIRDPDSALDPEANPGIDVPGFSPSEGSAGDRQAQLFELFDWAQRNGFDTNHPRFKSELVKRQLNPTPEEMTSMVRDLEWEQPIPIFRFLPGGQYRRGPFAPSLVEQDKNRRRLQSLRNMMGVGP